MAPNTTPVFLFSREKKEKRIYKQEIETIVLSTDIYTCVPQKIFNIFKNIR